MKIKVVYGMSKVDDYSKFEDNVNDTVRNLEKSECKVIDIKFTSSLIGEKIFHSAMIMYEKVTTEYS